MLFVPKGNVVSMIHEKIYALPGDIPCSRSKYIPALSPADSKPEYFILAGSDASREVYGTIQEHYVCP